MAFEFESRVRYSETGPDQKLTLVSLVDYFQDSSTFQSEDCGAGMNYLYEHDAAWMILSWQIDILRRPVLGEKIYAQTWPYGFKMFYGYRNYALLDANRNYLAKANSIWVLMNTKTGKPMKVPPEHANSYGLEEKLDMEYGSRKMKIPEESVKMEPFPVCHYHLDTNHHVNNGQYIRMAEEYLPAGFEASRLVVEYRQQAHLHDVIVPYVHQEENRVAVSLCDEEGKPYALLNLIRRESHKEGPTLVGGCLMSNLTRRDPLAGGSLVDDASGMKDIRQLRSEQNVKRQKIFTDERRIKIKIQREELCCRQEKKEN